MSKHYTSALDERQERPILLIVYCRSPSVTASVVTVLPGVNYFFFQTTGSAHLCLLHTCKVGSEQLQDTAARD